MNPVGETLKLSWIRVVAFQDGAEDSEQTIIRISAIASALSENHGDASLVSRRSDEARIPRCTHDDDARKILCR